jgi:hypothetical protein
VVPKGSITRLLLVNIEYRAIMSLGHICQVKACRMVRLVSDTVLNVNVVACIDVGELQAVRPYELISHRSS